MSTHRICVPARDPMTDTHIDVVAGQRLGFEAAGTWTDWGETCDADGYDAWYLRPTRGLWRVRRARLFALCGAIVGEGTTCFPIGRSATLEMPAAGRLKLFANDVPFMYFNNSGEISVTIGAAP